MPLKETVLSVAGHLGLSAVARRATARHLRILCYHGLWITPGYEFGHCTFISPEQFSARMERLKRSGLPVIPLEEAVNGLAAGTLPDNAVVITIDDAWASTFTHMLPVLEQHGMPSTLYATTWYSGLALPVVNVTVDYLRSAAGRFDIDPATVARRIDGLPVNDRLEALRSFGRELGVGEAWLDNRQFNVMSAAELAEARGRGMDIQLHTHRHIDVEAQVDTLAREVAENRAFLKEAVGDVPLDHFCYPSGTFHPNAPAILEACGVRSATTTDCGLNAPAADPFTLRRLLDGRSLSDAQFDAYLSGVHHLAGPLRRRLRMEARKAWPRDLRIHVGAAAAAAAALAAAAE